jgi:hypothetical protein
LTIVVGSSGSSSIALAFSRISEEDVASKQREIDSVTSSQSFLLSYPEIEVINGRMHLTRISMIRGELVCDKNISTTSM